LCNDEASTGAARQEVGVAGNSRELESGVDPHDEPSVEWGWHGSFYRAKITAGVVAMLILIAFLFGPYQSTTQYLWLLGIAAGLAFMIWRTVVARRNAWRQ
jgi:hypothetical protein